VESTLVDVPRDAGDEAARLETNDGRERRQRRQ
jgi:hypothetical protein